MDSLARQKRHTRTRAKVRGTATRPRVSVHRSLTRLNVQLIDDDTGTTLAAATGAANDVAGALIEQAKAQGISQLVFDRSGYKYHGRVKAVAEGLRAGGLNL